MRTKTIVIFVAANVFLFLVSCTAIVAVFSLIQKKPEDQLQASEKFRYHFHYLNPTTGENSVGLVDIFNELKGDDFETFEDTEGGHFIVSNEESDEYHCSGTCYCESYERRSTGVVSRSVMYLVAAFTSVVAYKVSQQYFDEECEKTFGDDDHSCVSIRADVDECRSFHALQSTTSSEDDTSSDDTSESDAETSNDKRRYQCTGNCVQGVINQRNPTFVRGVLGGMLFSDQKNWDKEYEGPGYIFDQMREGSKNVECSDLMLSTEFGMDEEFLSLYDKTEGLKSTKNNMKPIEREFAIRKLGPFCQSSSSGTIDVVKTIEDPLTRPRKLDVYYCDPDINNNPTIKCVEIP